MGNTIPHGDRLHECGLSCPEYVAYDADALAAALALQDWAPMDENVALHSMSGFHEHKDQDNRWCGFHSRLGVWTFSELRDPENPNSLYSKQCLRDDHPYANRNGFAQPTKQREGDQALPDGRLDLIDDQQLLINDIEARRQVGIERYGQGHRPFNGRDTMLDLYEEQLDLLVYFRSIRRMAEASREDLVREISDVIQKNGFQQIVGDAMAEAILDRMQGWLAAQMMEKTQ